MHIVRQVHRKEQASVNLCVHMFSSSKVHVHQAPVGLHHPVLQPTRYVQLDLLNVQYDLRKLLSK